MRSKEKATSVLLWLYAQADPSGLGTGTAELFTIVAQLGLSGVFFWMYMQERKERIAAQADLRGFLEKFAPTLATAIDTLKDVESGLSGTVAKVSAVPDKSTYDLALRRLELMLGEASELAEHLREPGGHGGN